MFYIVKLLVCNIQYVLLFDFNYKSVGLLIYNFFFRVFFIEDGIVAFQSEK